jgi:DNA/RNA-binding protein KIN17
MMVFAEAPSKFLSEYSVQFKDDFMRLMSHRHSSKFVNANHVYNEYIQDKQHVHMNATRWSSLAGFVQTMAREGLLEAQETEAGWMIKWVDRRPETMKQKQAEMRRERIEEDDEQRHAKLLMEQVEKATSISEAVSKEPARELIRDPEEKIRMSLGVKLGPKAGSGIKKPEPKKLNALVAKPVVLKVEAKKPLSTIEQIMQDELRKKNSKPPK